MNLAELLLRVEPSQLRQLAKLFQLEDGLPPGELIALFVQELPYCQTEQDGECVGIDGAYFVVADLIGDITTLDLLLETKWVRRDPSGSVINYHVGRGVEDMSLSDARLLLALLSIATSGEDELGIPPELGEPRFASVLHIEELPPHHPDAEPRLSQRPSQLPRSRRPSIPPGFSPTLESVRPNRPSVPPNDAGEPAVRPRVTSNRELVELVLTLPRNSLIAAAFALSERGSDSHAVSVGSRGRVVLRRDQLGVIEQLFLDVSGSIPQLVSQAERDEFEKQLAKNLTFYGIRSSDATAVVTCATDLGRFPEFYCDERPPPLEQVRSEFSLVSKRAEAPALQLLFDVFYRHCCATVHSLRHSLGLVKAADG
jgi:hypothetical protein